MRGIRKGEGIVLPCPPLACWFKVQNKFKCFSHRVAIKRTQSAGAGTGCSRSRTRGGQCGEEAEAEE